MMIRSSKPTRAGITLTEILISILIMGVGMVSLATLFPLGLLRLRDAQRWSRSAYLRDAAAADIEARQLLSNNSFTGAIPAPGGRTQYFCPWYTNPGFTTPYNPWIQDTPSATPLTSAQFGVYRGNPNYVPGGTVIPGPGLPVAYDPLWRYQANPSLIAGTNVPTGLYPGSLVNGVAVEGRFGSGLGGLLAQTDNGGGGPVSAYGLQRITNFDINQTGPANTINTLYARFGPNTVPDAFVSHDDVVLQSDQGPQTGFSATNVNGFTIPTGASTVVPDMSLGAAIPTGIPAEDWKFSWSFTGQQSDAFNTQFFDGNIVIWENRPFGVTQVNGQYVADGETVVEGVFGYAGANPSAATINALTANPAVGFARAGNRCVLLRWSSSLPDPEVKVGSWIADVTYERNHNVQGIPGVTAGRWQTGDYPYQRCFWYQIVKRTQPLSEAKAVPPLPAVGLGQGGFRAMTVWVSTPLQAQTLLNVTGPGAGMPAHNNAALIVPNVVAVFPRVINAP